MGASYLFTTRSRKTVRAAWDQLSWELGITPELERLVRYTPFMRGFSVAELQVVLGSLPEDDVHAHLKFLPPAEVQLARLLTKKKGEAWLLGLYDRSCSWSAHVKQGELRWAKYSTPTQRIDWMPTAFGDRAFPIPWRRSYTWAVDQGIEQVVGTELEFGEILVGLDRAEREQSWTTRLSSTQIRVPERYRSTGS